MQDEEYDELKKKRRQEMLAMRKKEQKFFERESVGMVLSCCDLARYPIADYCRCIHVIRICWPWHIF